MLKGYNTAEYDNRHPRRRTNRGSLKEFSLGRWHTQLSLSADIWLRFAVLDYDGNSGADFMRQGSSQRLCIAS